MNHLSLLNDEGLDTGRSDEFGRRVMEGSFHLSDDPSATPRQICLCSHGVDECMHCGRQSKP